MNIMMIIFAVLGFTGVLFLITFCIFYMIDFIKEGIIVKNNIRKLQLEVLEEQARLLKLREKLDDEVSKVDN